MERFENFMLSVMVTLVVAFTLLCALLVLRRARHRAVQRVRLRAIGELATMVGADLPPSYRAIDALAESYPIAVLAEALISVAEAVCGMRLYRVAMIAERSGVYDYLQRAAACSSSLGRARYLAMLAKFPLSRRYGDYVTVFADDEDEAVRFYTFVVQLVADAEAAVPRLASLERRLSPAELSVLLALLRRGDYPIAYTPLLRSENHNLRMLGVMVASHFGDADCEPLLHSIVGREDTTSVEALYALASLRGNVAREEVQRLVSGLPASRRRSLCRHFAYAGYSCGALGELLDAGEQHYFEELLSSYKRPILCS